MVASTLRSILCFTNLLRFSTSGDEVCKDETCESRRLRWRPFPYYVSHPTFARKVYGGDFVSRAFAQHFDGPEDNEDWDLLWTHRKQTEALLNARLPARDRIRLVNHCPTFESAGNKCEFARLTRRLSKKTERRYLPSFILGEELEAWRETVMRDPDQYWVLKPCLGGASKGIQIHRGLDALKAQPGFGADAVAQEYVKPFLGFGYKFHLRIYLLVTRWAPLGAYLFNEGLVFWSKSRHDTSNMNTEDHIFSGISRSISAMTLAALWTKLDSLPRSRLIDDPSMTTSEVVRTRILHVVSELIRDSEDKSFLTLPSTHGYSCFDLLGADVILDEALQPHLMEINVGPNIWIDNHGEEYERVLGPIKVPLIDQVAHWAALRIKSSDVPSEDEIKSIERQSLKNFTRVV